MTASAGRDAFVRAMRDRHELRITAELIRIG